MKKTLGVVLLALFVLSACGPEKKDVRIAVSMPPRLDMTQYDYIYLPGFVTEAQHDSIDTEREALNFMRREFLRKGDLQILKLNPVDLSGQDPRAFFVREQPYFQRFNFPQAKRTLAVTGVIGFEAVDRSGFREVEYRDFQGRELTRTQYVEITGFNLNMRVYVYELTEGKLLYTDVIRDTMNVEGSNPDERLVLFDLMTRASDRIIGLFSNTLVRAERSLL